MAKSKKISEEGRGYSIRKKLKKLMKKRKVAEGRVYVEKQERKKERLTEIKVSVFFNFLPLLKLSLTVFTFEIQNRTNTRM